jgi:cyclophilin family peptidyl-prolyl cis-trans isomerase
MSYIWHQNVRPTKVTCKTTKGDIDIIVERNWSPNGAARFLELVDDGFYKDVPFFRCVDNFLCQFGAVPARPGAKVYAPVPDDPQLPVLRNFKRGYVSFAGNGPNSRATHMFITLGDNLSSLGTMPWETPIGYVSAESMQNVVSRFNTSYGDIPPWGKGPEPGRIEAQDGAMYLKQNFPEMDYILSCSRG